MDTSSNRIFKHRARKKAKKTRKDCSTLYDRGGPGWECGLGWTNAISGLSYRLECANRIFKRLFRVHVVADQVKEKFGELRFYYTIVRDVPPLVEWICRKITVASDSILENADFRKKSVTIEPAQKIVKCREITKSPNEFAYTTLNSSKILESSEEDFRCELTEIHRYEISKLVPTRHKLLWTLAKACKSFSVWISNLYSVDTNRQAIGMEGLDTLAFDAVHKAEKECYSTCEECGREIGTDFSPRCETTGWITYLCEQCARNRGHGYKKNGKLYDASGNEIPSKKTCSAPDEGGA